MSGMGKVVRLCAPVRILMVGQAISGLPLATPPRGTTFSVRQAVTPLPSKRTMLRSLEEDPSPFKASRMRESADQDEEQRLPTATQASEATNGACVSSPSASGLERRRSLMYPSLFCAVCFAGAMRVISEEEELIASCVTAEDIDKVSDGADYWRCRGSGCTAAQRPACELFACAACGVVRPAARLALDQRMVRTVATCVRDAEVGATTCVQSVVQNGEAAPAIDVSLPFEGAWPRACSALRNVCIACLVLWSVN